MLSLFYLALVFLVGDSVCRRSISFVSTQHRIAAGFLSGLLLSSWFTYLAALLFYRTGQPLIWANLTYAIAAVLCIVLLRRRDKSGEPGDGLLHRLWERTLSAANFRKEKVSPTRSAPPIFDAARRPVGDGNWDLVVLAICVIFGCWLIFATLSTDGDNILFAVKAWSDFGANLSLSQSMAVGHNFPTEHPFFPGDVASLDFAE